MAGVTLKDVAKRYGNVPVIENINLEIHDHEFMVLVGPSGCGKSTLLRMVAGLEEISSGTISIAGRVVNDLPPKDRDISMVFQSYALYPHMTVRENLDFGLRVRETPPAEIGRLVEEAAQTLEITHLLGRKPKELSGGQRQRVALGRALVRKPAVFLFDEPLSNLDAKLRVQMRAEIKKLQHRLQTTSIYVTHDQTEAMTMGHRIAILNAGKLQQVGSPLEVYERPVNVFVANFIGSPQMNLIRGTVEAGGGAIAARGFRLPVGSEMRALLAGRAGKEVVAGIRPEHIHGKGEAGRGEATQLEATAEIVETLGDSVVVHGRVGAELLAFRLPPRSPPAFGEVVPISIELTSIHLFDGETEQRLSP